MVPNELEAWLSAEGDKVVRIVATRGAGSLSFRDSLVYEIWLLDTEQRNGGISQYFCNRGKKHWRALSELAPAALPSFVPFAADVDDIVGRSTDAYQAVIDSKFDLDMHYVKFRDQLVMELKEAVSD